jgi:DNA-binding transcriptional ArsR family regulator
MDELNAVFHALANDHRRQIIHELAIRPRSISELAAHRGLSLPAIHKHLRTLEEADMIRRHKTGRTTVIALRRAPLRRLQAWVDQFHPYWGSDSEALDNYADHFDNHSPQPKE